MLPDITFSDLLNFFLALSWLAALLTIPSVLLQRSGKPTAALSWLFALFALPSLAVAAWWLFGRTHLRRKTRRRLRSAQTTSRSLQDARAQVLEAINNHAKIKVPRSRLAPCMPPDLADTVFPATAGNSVELLTNAIQVHRAWVQLIKQAQHHIHLQFYIWRDDQIGRLLRDKLILKVAKGVEVRVLYDAVGSFSLPNNFFAPLIQQGGRVAAFMPIRLLSLAPTVNFRNHRKVIIADAEHAYTGSINVGDEYLDWQDIGIIIHGPGVNQLQEVFVDDWHFTTAEDITDSSYFYDLPADNQAPGKAVCETVASGPHQSFNTMRDMMFLAINQCQQRLWIATPYFIPGPALVIALRTAAYRGVDVRLILPSESDSLLVRQASRVFYQELLAGGVRIFEYHGMLHAKALLLDDDTVFIGSANLDVRSFRLNFELSTFVTEPEVNQQLKSFFETLQSASGEVTADDIRKATTLTRLQDTIAHLLSPLL